MSRNLLMSQWMVITRNFSSHPPTSLLRPFNMWRHFKLCTVALFSLAEKSPLSACFVVVHDFSDDVGDMFCLYQERYSQYLPLIPSRQCRRPESPNNKLV